MADSHPHARSISRLEERVETLTEQSAAPLEDEDRAALAETLVTLADAYGSRGEFDAEGRTIDRLEELGTAESADSIDAQLAAALANATAIADRQELYETGIDPERLESHRDRLETLYRSRPEAAIAAPLATATARMAYAYGKAERPDRIPSLVDRLETLYEDHPDADVAAALAEGHAHAERYVDGSPTTDRLERAETLYEAHSDDAVAASLAGVVAGRTNADAATEDLETIEERIAWIEALAQRHSDAAAIERWLPIACANATRASFEAADYERLEYWGDRTLDLHESLDTPTSASWAAAATFYSARGSFFEGELERGETKLERLRSFERAHENPVFEHWLARSMFDAARGYAELGHYEQARSMADDLATYAEGHDDQERIEAGLESLRATAPGLFGEGDDAGGVADERATDADETGAATTAPGEPSVQSGGAEETTTGPGRTPNDGLDALESSSKAPGCGSCGPDGCGSCGTGGPATEPADARTLVGAGVVLTLGALAILYGGYRLVKAAVAAAR